MQRIDRVLRQLASQHTARTNASQASAKLRKRRHEQEDVDAYLEALHGNNPTTARAARNDGSPSSAHGTTAITDTR